MYLARADHFNSLLLSTEHGCSKSNALPTFEYDMSLRSATKLAQAKRLVHGADERMKPTVTHPGLGDR